MIYEYAIQPEVLVEWAKTQRDFRMFERSFGLGTTRIISTFPAQQSRKLQRYLLRKWPSEMDGLAATRYDAIIEKILECLAVRKFENKDIPLEEWEALVIAEDQVKPFGVILSESSLNVERNITLNGVYELDQLWEHPRQVGVYRTSESLYNSLKGLLELSSQKITIADPYGFAPGATKFIAFILNELKKTIKEDQFPEVHLIFDVNKPTAASVEHVRSDILNQIGSEFFNTKLKVRGIASFHNRYIFTEHGGISLGHGISLSGDHTQVDEITLLDKKIYEQRLKDFSE